MENNLSVVVSTFMGHTYSFLVKFTDSKRSSIKCYFKMKAFGEKRASTSFSMKLSIEMWC